MNYRYAVVTQIDAGDLANTTAYDLTGKEQICVLQQLFTVGEIMILDNTGREVAGRRRMPSKWGVYIAVYASLEAAITKAVEVTNISLWN